MCLAVSDVLESSKYNALRYKSEVKKVKKYSNTFSKDDLCSAHNK